MTELLEVGHIAKPHGLGGDVIVKLVTDRTERLSPGTVLTGPSGPLVVERSSPHQGRWIVHFAGVDDREGADALRGVVLTAPPLADPDAMWVHELIGSMVVDGGVERGRVVSVVANPASDLLELDSGALVPLRFVTGRVPGRVDVDAPAGLFDEDRA